MNHEEYFYRTLYTIVIVSPNGGQNMDYFTKEVDAIADANRIEEAMKEGGVEGYSIFLSELDYDHRKNRIVSGEFITDESRLMYEC